jgi:hypothetical protein
MARRAGGALSRLSVQVLEAELRRREKGVGRLERKRAKLQSRLDALEDLIRSHGGSPGSGNGRRGRRGGGGRRGRRGGGRRPHNEMSLEKSLAKLLNGKTMAVTDIAEAVQRAGYRTGAENFRTIVNQTLIRSDLFKKIARGQYTAK